MASRLEIAAHLLEALCTVNLAAIVVFDLALRSVSIVLPDIVTDIAIGAGYLAATAAVMHAVGVNATSALGASAVVSADPRALAPVDPRERHRRRRAADRRISSRRAIGSSSRTAGRAS